MSQLKNVAFKNLSDPASTNPYLLRPSASSISGGSLPPAPIAIDISSSPRLRTLKVLVPPYVITYAPSPFNLLRSLFRPPSAPLTQSHTRESKRARLLKAIRGSKEEDVVEVDVRAPVVVLPSPGGSEESLVVDLGTLSFTNAPTSKTGYTLTLSDLNITSTRLGCASTVVSPVTLSIGVRKEDGLVEVHAEMPRLEVKLGASVVRMMERMDFGGGTAGGGRRQRLGESLRVVK